jgi:hypothetical protein
VDTRLGGIGKTTQQVQAKQASLGDTFKRSWTEINSMLGVARQAYQAVNQVVQETVGEFVKYANEVRTLTQINNQSAESNSRLIQTLDDFKVTTDDIITGQRKMATQGKSLTIPVIAEMAEEYQNIIGLTQNG